MGQLINLVGQRFGKLLVTGRAPNTYTKSGHQKINWFCVCDCGREIIVDGKSLRSGATQSCGFHKQKDITGQKFGKLTAIRIVGQDEYSRNIWECLCDCGKYTRVMVGNLTSGAIQSCGCGHDGHPTHRETKTRLFNIWEKMKGRCYCETNDAYKNYGGRGISICNEWKENFLNFKEWAIANGYTDELTIERKDVNGNYCPENCCWITKGEQRNNRTDTLYFNGKTLKEIAEESGLKYNTINYHYYNGDLKEWLFNKGFSVEA